ncbi:MAG: hypothetical protein U0269_37765 [Polyangiales bacterium]
MPSDIAESLEDRADKIWRKAFQIALPLRAANDDELVSTTPRWPIDRVAEALGIRLEEDEMPALLLGIYFRAQNLIIVNNALRPIVRTTVVSHECGHGALAAGAPHGEVWYLALALLIPRCLTERIPDERPITCEALLQVCPWDVPLWVARVRAQLLRRLEAVA